MEIDPKWDDFTVLAATKSFKEAMDGYNGFRSIGVPLFESEDVTDNLLKIYLALIPNEGWEGNHQAYNATGSAMADIGSLYLHGLWLPCVQRFVFAGQVDVRNDGLPDFAAIPRFDNGLLGFFSVRRLAKCPRGWGSLPAAKAFYMANYFDPTHKDNRIKVTSFPMSVIGDKVMPLIGNVGAKGGNPVAALAMFSLDTAATLSTPSDFRSLWNVQTEESTLGGKNASVQTPLRLGVDGEIVKSLFYARQAPLTESGRKRPILHWVRSHQRRIKEGVDVDISKHLRGITKFEMDGFPFTITNPTK